MKGLLILVPKIIKKVPKRIINQIKKKENFYKLNKIK